MSRKRPEWQLHTPAPMPEPPPLTPVAADHEQMAELMQLMGADAGPRMITAALADATPLDIEARRQQLSGYSLRPTIRAVSTQPHSGRASCLAARVHGGPGYVHRRRPTCRRTALSQYSRSKGAAA